MIGYCGALFCDALPHPQPQPTVPHLGKHLRVAAKAWAIESLCRDLTVLRVSVRHLSWCLTKIVLRANGDSAEQFYNATLSAPMQDFVGMSRATWK